jgi:hypothetical protein
MSAADYYPVIEVLPEEALDQEVLGSKEKFWHRHDSDDLPWLFKFAPKNTGQSWAEKVAAELADVLHIRHAVVERNCSGCCWHRLAAEG